MATDTVESMAACKVVQAAVIAKDLLHEVAESISKLGKPPVLVGFLANEDPAAGICHVYFDLQSPCLP